MSNEKQEHKALPFRVKEGWTAFPHVISTIYSKHPKWNGTAFMVYSYLLQRHNANYGYAFPSQVEMAQTLHISDSTVKTALKTLLYLGLITKRRNPGFDNDVYYLHKPIETDAEFTQRFPEVIEAEQKHSEVWQRILGQRGSKPKQKVVEDHVKVTEGIDDDWF
jgi:predicted transcriptional regulator